MPQRGVPIWQAAEYAGMSEETFRKTYAHHHPDYLKEARDSHEVTNFVTLRECVKENECGEEGVRRTPIPLRFPTSEREP